MQPILSKDSANFAEYTICEDKNRKSIPYLTFFIFIPEMQPILSKDSANFPFHQMFDGFSRHFRHVIIFFYS